MKIVQIDPNVAFMVVFENDRPLTNTDGRPVLFYRKSDAQRFIDEDPRE